MKNLAIVWGFLVLFILGDAALDLAHIYDSVLWLIPAAGFFTGAIMLAVKIKMRLDVFDRIDKGLTIDDR